jgi:hypothetical protein
MYAVLSGAFHVVDLPVTCPDDLARIVRLRDAPGRNLIYPGPGIEGVPAARAFELSLPGPR